MAKATEDPKVEAQSAGTLLMFIGPGALPDNDQLTYDPQVGPVIHGSTFTLDDTTYEALSSNPYIAPYLMEVDTDYTDATRAELEQTASDAGIEDPGDYDLYPHEGSLAAAIELAKIQPTEVEHMSIEDQGASAVITSMAEAAPEEPEAPAESTPEEGGE